MEKETANVGIILSLDLVYLVLCARVCATCARVTREHRENLAKLAKQLSNKAKDSLRRVRSSAVTQAKKAKEGHSEDTVRLVEKQVGAVALSSSLNL